MSKGKHKLWTMNELDQVCTLWDSQTMEEIANRLGRSMPTVYKIVGKLRKAGYDLPVKRKNAYMDTLIKDFVTRKSQRSPYRAK